MSASKAAKKAKVSPRAGSRAAAKAKAEAAEQKRIARNEYTRAWRAQQRAQQTQQEAPHASTRQKRHADVETVEAPSTPPVIPPGSALLGITKAQLVTALEMHLAAELARDPRRNPRAEAFETAISLAELLRES